MKAQVIEQFGEPGVFKEMDLPRPEVIPGHVLIRVLASSVNPIDFIIRRGIFQVSAFKEVVVPAFPAVLHGDVAGVIEEVGEGVTAFNPGDEVYACAGGVKGLGGALAEFMLADADLVALKPKSLTMQEAAALPLVSITAWEGLIDRAKIQPGQTVLVHGITGGVSHIAIQLAKSVGARVFATGSSEEKLEKGHGLGADGVINYRTQSVSDYVAEYTGGQGFDIVFDTIGNENLSKSFEAATLQGTVISSNTYAPPDMLPLHLKGLNLHALCMLIPMLSGMSRAHHGEILSKIAQLVDDGKVRPLIDPNTFSFADVASAHHHLESGKAIGKVTLVQ